MKKLFLLAAAAVSVAANAQLIEFNGSAQGLKTDPATAVKAGTVLGENDAIAVKTVFDDDMKQVNVKHNGFDFYQVGNAVTTDTMGIQGANNPKDADGGNPANAATIPASGSIIEVFAKQDGYIYVFHKASSNKQYCVEEGDANGMTPIGHHHCLLTKDKDGVFGEAGALKLISYTITGDNEYNQLTKGEKIDFVEDYAKAEGDTMIGKNNYKQNGPAVIVVKVYKDYKYWIHATGSKISANAVFFTADPTVTVTAHNAEDEALTTLLYDGSYAVSAVENVAAEAAAEKFVKDGQIYIRKNGVLYNVLGTKL